MTVDHNSPDIWTNLGSAISAQDELEFQSAISKFLASNVAFDNYLLIAYFAAERPVVLSHESQSPRVHAEIETHYVQSHYLLDPFYIAHCNAVQAGAYSLSDVAPDKFRSTAYFKKYYERTTLLDEIAFFAYPANGWTLNICIGRDETSGLSFSKADIRRARRIAPVVSALLETRYRSATFRRSKAARSGDPINDLRRRLKSRNAIDITARQAQVAVLILRGHSAKSISAELGISWHTVRVFRRQLYQRCGVTSQAELFSMILPLL
ncbi:MAG: helix-turn-helix transcriptional regulator [Sedimentitalea sp.]|uniref:helix-turn-helix transcriptional regulator n=1 Tax=Sedimentitalea sp. TaxID=2048915 RepID=UPI003266F960